MEGDSVGRKCPEQANPQRQKADERLPGALPAGREGRDERLRRDPAGAESPEESSENVSEQNR